MQRTVIVAIVDQSAIISAPDRACSAHHPAGTPRQAGVTGSGPKVASGGVPIGTA